ncbi:tRNA 5-methoxyuridine(34)/uridine 5-oxyacetic acid(34) synthase CmoB [Methylomonas paludis]|uniref:tRNA U34 carboxymethyltransferase n=1 Tax=Methylomonas paludis TaxID=1173101 RepID=A0A975MLW6_9GAMM|nr:tRNA 5-methoxyuridine(34)/uridine 5-oxyacetic acid(34) synthase CmoB [Methylomonas paludis]QWF70212.1 tRNA 5-methoxyuridine(34)/uridine 5-oxyacetic acid(34) synthase CmoB [Methylomonas paludis]
MTGYQSLYAELAKVGGAEWLQTLPAQLQNAFASDSHGDLPGWQAAIDQLPELPTITTDLLNEVRIGTTNDLTPEQARALLTNLTKLHPWRKGPFNVYGINIDSEWRSDWKWERCKDHISPLQNRLVLDVGCGNGYHCWRMLGAGAKLVIGIDPTLLSVMQFQAIKKLYGAAAIHVLPLAVEDMPANLKLFDTVFSMGVLYHRRSPIDHLLELKACLRPGGELILETLVILGGSDSVLVPAQRYAQMRNVWFLPSCEALMGWMRRCGYRNIRLLDISKTTSAEQRSTTWMRFHSLADFLDADNPDLTCEGLPAPVRAMLVANID